MAMPPFPRPRLRAVADTAPQASRQWAIVPDSQQCLELEVGARADFLSSRRSFARAISALCGPPRLP